MNIQISSHEEIQKAFAEGEEAILALFDKFEAQVKVLAEQLEIQAAAIKELQAKAAKNSSNSSKPPSSDGYGKKNVPPASVKTARNRTVDNLDIKARR
jgi:hypothetical protein